MQRCLETAWAPEWTVTCVGDDLGPAPFPGSTAQALLLVACPAPATCEFVHVFQSTLEPVPQQTPCWGPWVAVADGDGEAPRPATAITFPRDRGLAHLPPAAWGASWTHSLRIVLLCSEGCPEARAVFVLEPARATPPPALVDVARAVACNACRLARGSTWTPAVAATMPAARKGADTLQSWLEKGAQGQHAVPPGLAVRFVAKAPACTGKFGSWAHAWWRSRQQRGDGDTPRALVVVGGVGALATRASQLQAWLPEARVVVIATKAHLGKATWAGLLAADFVLTTSVFLASAANATHLAHVARQLVACAAAPRNRGGHRLLAAADLVQVFDPKLTVVDDDGCSGTNFFRQAAASAPVLQAAARGLRDVIQATDDGHAPPPPWYDFRGPVLHLVPWTAIVGASLPCKDPLATMATLAAVTGAGTGAPPPTSRCFLVETRDVDHDCIVGQSVRCRVRGEGQDATAVVQWRPTAILTNRAPVVPAAHHVALAPSTAELEAIRDNSGWAAFMGSWLAWEAPAHVTQLWARLGFEPVPTDEAVDAVLNLHVPRLQQVARYVGLCKPRQVWVLEPRQRPDVWCALDVQPQGPVGLHVPPVALLPLPTQPPPLSSAGRPAWVQALEQAQCMLQHATDLGLQDEQEEVSRQSSRLHGVLSTAAHTVGLASVAGDPAFHVFTLASAADELRKLVHECVAQEARMRAVALGDVCPLCCHRPCATLFPCGHMACVDCTVTWRRSQPGCYVCRQPCQQVFVLTGAQGPDGGSSGGAAAAAALPPLSMCPRLPWFALPTDWPPDSWIGQQWARACLRGGGGGPAFSSLAFWVACVLMGHQPVPDPARAPDPTTPAAPTVVLVHTPSHGLALVKALTRIHNGSDRGVGDGVGDARPLVMFKGSVEERMALQASFQTGNCHLCVVVSDVAAGVKVAGVHTLLAMVPAASLQPAVLRALRPSGAVITMSR